MIILGPILRGFIQLALMILSIYKIVLIIRIIMSFVNPDPYNPFVRTVMSITDPILSRIRQWIPFLRAGVIDFSPIVVFVIIWILEDILMNFHYAVGPASRMSGGVLF